MSHYLTGVIIPKDMERDVESAIKMLMAPYDENRDVAPYKEYMSKDDIQRMKKHYGLTKASDLIVHMKDWHGRDGGKDKTGLFYWTQYNPDSKWDWYRVGGRWDGAVTSIDVSSEDGGFNFHDNHETLELNMARVKDAKVECFAFVTPDGMWHERAEMGWFGMTSNDKTSRAWTRTKNQIKKQYADHLIVGVDCHI